MEAINKFVENFAKQFADVDIPNVKVNTIFRDLETWDSLTGMAVLIMIQDEYGKTLTEDEFKTLSTPEQVYNYIMNK